jgi:hypothetical protein
MVFSSPVGMLTGYGYRLGRILVAYVLVILFCAVAYYVLGIFFKPDLSPLDAVLISITAFYGRIFAEPYMQAGKPQRWVTAFEAMQVSLLKGLSLPCSLNDFLVSKMFLMLCHSLSKT